MKETGATYRKKGEMEGRCPRNSLMVVVVVRAEGWKGLKAVSCALKQVQLTSR